jgi:hypothetical protein
MVPRMASIETVEAVLWGLAVYAAVGAAFALIFLLAGLTRIDNGAKGAGFVFRLLIIPGLIALWPLMLIRWLSGGQPHGG